MYIYCDTLVYWIKQMDIIPSNCVYMFNIKLAPQSMIQCYWFCLFFWMFLSLPNCIQWWIKFWNEFLLVDFIVQNHTIKPSCTANIKGYLYLNQWSILMLETIQFLIYVCLFHFIYVISLTSINDVQVFRQI